MTGARLLGAIVASLVLGAVARADTGTYEILDASVRLSVRVDGAVEIAYAQTWKVLGGHIPWVTVGAAGPDFEIPPGRLAGNAASIRAANRGGWSGVRLELDGDYREGEEFEVGFTIVQRGLFYAAGGSRYRLEFVPGWYDRAWTHRLVVRLEMFRELSGIEARPEADVTEPAALEWRRTGLRPGERVRIRVEMPRDLFPAPIELGRRKSSFRSSAWAVVGASVVAILGFLFAMILAFRRGGYGHGGRIGRSGGFRHPGCVVSCACACACVSCACACACAGGGAAGCDRKLRHECPLCRDCGPDDCRVPRRASG